MSGLIFLAIGLGVALFGTFVLWLFSRERKHFDSSIRDFEQNMGALDPEKLSGKRGRRGS